MEKLRNEKGFTLIELVVIIVILGILSVIAVPKYLDLKSEAELGTAKGVTAALRGAIAINHARYLMNGTDYNATTIADNIETEDITVAATNATGSITATFPSTNVYTWTYTVRSDNTPAKVAGPTGP